MHREFTAKLNRIFDNYSECIQKSFLVFPDLKRIPERMMRDFLPGSKAIAELTFYLAEEAGGAAVDNERDHASRKGAEHTCREHHCSVAAGHGEDHEDHKRYGKHNPDDTARGAEGLDAVDPAQDIPESHAGDVKRPQRTILYVMHYAHGYEKYSHKECHERMLAPERKDATHGYGTHRYHPEAYAHEAVTDGETAVTLPHPPLDPRSLLTGIGYIYRIPYLS